MGSQSPRLEAIELYRLKWRVGALIGFVSTTTLFNIDGHSKVPALIVLAVVGACFAQPRLYARIPTLVWNGFAIGIVPLVVVDVLSGETAPALLNLNTWLILYRSLNHDKRREEMQLVVLCLFLLVMTGILTTSLIFALQLLAFAALAMIFLSLGEALHCKSAGNSDGFSGRSAWLEGRSSVVDLPRLVRSKIALAGCMFVALIGCGSVFFLVIPRVDSPEQGRLFQIKSNRSYSGFSENISLGEVTDIKQDKRVALRVDVSNAIELPEMPYWRMLALDRYENGTFSLSPELKDLLRNVAASPYHSSRYWPNTSFESYPSEGNLDRWTFYMEPGISRFLPILGRFQHFVSADREELSIGPQMHIVALPETPGKMVSYQLEGLSFDAVVPDISASEVSIYLRSTPGRNDWESSATYPHSLLGLPEDPVAASYLKSLAREIVGNKAASSSDFALRAVRHLEDTHRYSTQSSVPEHARISDPVTRWLQSGEPGHCELFASSFTLLARAAGYPARSVVGYKGGEWNAYENYYMVRNSDAHAWAEIYDGRGSWIRVDPTPGSRPPSVEGNTVLASDQIGVSGSLAYIDSLRMLWYRQIVNFDQQAQKDAAARLGDFFTAYGQVAREWTVRAMQALNRFVFSAWSPAKVFGTAGVAFLVCLVFWAQRRLTLNLRELLLVPFRKGDPIRRKAGRLLAKCGTLCETEGEARVVGDLRRLRFGPKHSWPDPRTVFRAARRLR